MNKKRIAAVIVVVMLAGMKLFSDRIYFQRDSNLSQKEFYEHFHLQPISEESGFEEYFVNVIYDNPYVFLFRHDPTYVQRYFWSVNENEIYSVELAACDSKNGYNVNRIGDHKNYDVVYTYDLTVNGMDVYLEMVKMLYDSVVYDYRMSFEYKDKYYSITLYGMDDPAYQSHDGLNEYYHHLIVRLINELF
ncbi:hypothetical protein [uncultured Traorella sp.]|uniref:hypothetical protein n=1 Tax=uncultured Traorella sp. TaxID=1929048 RepID=UPI0025F6C803|nr:hypothetical protein [uncultured Traorella sp.]